MVDENEPAHTALWAYHRMVHQTTFRAVQRLGDYASAVARNEPFKFREFVSNLTAHGVVYRSEIEPLVLLASKITLGCRRVAPAFVTELFIDLAGGILLEAIEGPMDDLQNRVDLAVAELNVTLPGRMANAVIENMIGIDIREE